MTRPLLAIVTILFISLSASAADIKIPGKGILPLDGKPFHPFVLKNLDGKTVDSKSLQGHWVFLHFWASWCGPCRKELPAIQRMTKIMKAAKLKIVLINTAETEDIVFNFFGTLAVDLDTLIDTNGQLTEKYKPRGLPTTFLIDPSGKMRYIALGGQEWDKKAYIEFLHQLLKSK